VLIIIQNYSSPILQPKLTGNYHQIMLTKFIRNIYFFPFFKELL